MKRNKGFTLVELLVVIAIIGILSSVVFASLNSARAKARAAAAQSTLRSVMPELQTCADDGGVTTATTPAGGETVCKTTAGGSTPYGNHTVTWPALSTAGSWAYEAVAGDLANNSLVYKAKSDSDKYEITCTFSTGSCSSVGI